MNWLVGNQMYPSDFHNYLVAGNVVNAFALGELGASDDFYLIGAETEDDSGYPLLTGTILNSEGQVLFQLVQNELRLNPGHCSKTQSNLVGYEIHDSAGVRVLSVKTLFEPLPSQSEPVWVTTLGGEFYDKNGSRVFSANSGEPGERIAGNVKSAYGIAPNGGFGMVMNMSSEETQLARQLMSAKDRQLGE